MAGINERFGEKVELPEGYRQFWKEYQQILTDGNGTLGKSDHYYLENPKHHYLNQRIPFLLPGAGVVSSESDRERMILTSDLLASISVIHDRYTYHYNRDDAYGEPTIPDSGEKEMIISLHPEIETVLYAEEIRRYRKTSPKLEEIKWFTWLNGNSAGNPHKVGVLLDLFDDYYASREKSWQEHRVQGNELLSLPSSYPIEKNIAELYVKIGRKKFDSLAEKYFDLRRALYEARKIDPHVVAGLEKSVHEQYMVMRKEILVKL